MGISRTAYEVLGLAPSATKEQVNSAYRLAARLNHPDKGGDPRIFAEIATAYSLIKALKVRREYDAQLRLERNVCHKCDGEGVITEITGWKTRQKVICPVCGGVGSFEVKGKNHV